MKITSETMHKRSSRPEEPKQYNPLLNDRVIYKNKNTDISDKQLNTYLYNLKMRYRIYYVVVAVLILILGIGNISMGIKAYENINKEKFLSVEEEKTTKEKERLEKEGERILSDEEYRITKLREKYAIVKEGEEVVSINDE